MSQQLSIDLSEIMAQAQRPRSILSAAAGAVLKLLRGHFRDRDQTPNQLGGKRTHFWLDVLRSTQRGPIDNHSSSIVIGDPRFAQKVYGGTIVAKNVKFLTIPQTAEAHGRRAAVFEAETGLELFLLHKEGRPTGALAALDESGAVRVHYLLRKSVDQEADPDALPEWSEVESVAREAAQTQLDTEIQRAQQTRN